MPVQMLINTETAQSQMSVLIDLLGQVMFIPRKSSFREEPGGSRRLWNYQGLGNFRTCRNRRKNTGTEIYTDIFFYWLTDIHDRLKRVAFLEGGEYFSWVNNYTEISQSVINE